MIYKDAVEYILDIPKFTKKNKLEHTKRFLKELGDPQERLKVIHVAGTNGKGSVCVYLDAMLRAEGKRTGVFLSPHLIKMNERMILNGTMITDEAFLESFECVMAAVQRLQAEGLPHPTFFEFIFGMAMDAFDRAGMEYAVLETGLGGRLDATNSVKKPVCTVIASIGLDHMSILGSTIEEIAAEKAGIMKNEVPLLFIESSPKSDEVIENAARRQGIFCKKVDKNALKLLKNGQKDIAFLCRNAYYKDVIWKLHNIGIYQAENAMLALEVMRYLVERTDDFTGEEQQKRLEKWQQALAEVHWQGRMEEILPDIYVDGAHNVSAIERFTETLRMQPKEPGSRRIILFSAVEDKDYEEMIRILCRRTDADEFVITKIHDKRAADSTILEETFKKYTTKPVNTEESLEAAFAYACSIKGERTIYCLGSLYLVGMIKSMIKEGSYAEL